MLSTRSNVVLAMSRLFKLAQSAIKVRGTSYRSLMQRDDKDGVMNGAQKDLAKRRGLAIFCPRAPVIPSSSNLLRGGPSSDCRMKSIILRKPGSTIHS